MNDASIEMEQIGSIATEINAPTLRITRGVFELWQAEKSKEFLPKWQAIGAGRLGELLPFVYVLDIIDNGTDFRMRFMGSAIVQSIGEDLTGVKLSDHMVHPSAWRADIYRQVIARKAPMFTAVDLGDFDREFTKTECVLLPVANWAGEFSMIMCAAAPYQLGSGPVGVKGAD